jgi:hypothetical protein
MNKGRRWKAKARRKPQPNAGWVAIDMGGQTWHFRSTGKPVAWLHGLKPLAPFTLNLRWDDGKETCAVCSTRFTVPALQPVPQLEMPDGGRGLLCDPCAMALLATAD